MAKLAYGVPDKHILKSQGSDNDLLKFYCTQNATTYGAKWEKFLPRSGGPSGSGYVSNIRPTITYSSHLDAIDNPTMGRIVAGNYHSISDLSFTQLTGATGAEPLPNSVHPAGSGFVRGKQVHVPTQHEARQGCIGHKVSMAPAVDILPRHKPILHIIQAKDPVEMENGGYGPGCMTTETGERFRSKSSHFNYGQRTIGNNELSGFTHNHNVEPLTFHPDYAYECDTPGYMTTRPTGLSLTMTDYRPFAGDTGKEALPRISNRASHDTGFSVGTKVKPIFLPTSDNYSSTGEQMQMKIDLARKDDPMEHLNLTHPNNRSSVAQNVWLGKQRNDPTEAYRLGGTSVGKKEDTGFTTNNPGHFLSADNPARFVTDYQTRFYDKNPRGTEREGHVSGGVLRQKEDGFTKNTHTHSFGPQSNSSETLRHLEPYAARSIKFRDIFYDDHAHDSKLRTVNVIG